MRIQDSSSLREIDKQSQSTSPVKKVLSGLFAASLAQQEDEIVNYQEDIATLRREIEMAGDKLSKEPILPNFKLFRELLSRLAKRINTEAYRLDKIGGTPQNPRYFEIITVINREADDLYNLILRENRNTMKITATVIGIKGLVVDLVT